jgi:cysteine desulfurase family protein (TIGR01976 family)
MDLDVERVRAHFPALADGTAYFDGPGGSQTPREVADAVASALVAGLSNRGSVTASERRADEIVVGARRAVADLLGADAGGVVFGRSMTQLTYDLSRSLARGWGPGDEVVVTRLDHDADIRPWVSAADRVGATVRWVEFDPGTAELSFDPGVLSERTRLVAVTGASNLLGTRPDVPAIAAAVHEAGALLFVDGVHLTPHAPVAVGELGADFFVCSPYKFFGPHLGVLAAAPALLETVRPDKLLPSTDAVPERFELGTLPYELLAGTTAAVDFIASLASGSAGDDDRRARVLASMQRVEQHEDRLFDRLLAGLDGIGGVTRFGRPARRTPTVLFEVEGRSGREVHEHLATRGVNAPASSFYALEASHRLGLGDAGAVRAGLAPYTSEQDVDRLLEAVGEVAK